MKNRVEWIPVPVPEPLVPDVYRLVLERHPEATGFKAPEAEEKTGWTEDLVERMWDESPEGSIQPFLRALAERRGEWVPTSELVELIAEARGEEVTRPALGGMLGAFGRRVSNRYGMDESPFERQWSDDRGEHLYRLREEVAEVIRDVDG